jgi:dTDP-4-dehydrorhamnose reductase
VSSILVLGAYGLVGQSLCLRYEAAGCRVLRQGRRAGSQLRFDPIDIKELISVFCRERPDSVVNLVSATNVDACETNPALAYHANVRPVEMLVAAICSVGGTRPNLVQISTDHVYDGLGPHLEDGANPCNVYALSKFAGELAASRADATILRVNLFGRSRARERISLSDWIVGSLRTGKRITVFDDVLFSALHLNTLCDYIVRATEMPKPGVFNVGSKDGISKADFAFALADALQLDRGLMTVGKSSAANLRARRPLDMRMNVGAFETTFNVVTPSIESQIRIASSEYFDA